MATLDWAIVLIYVAVLIAMSYLIGRKQKDQDDYYLGGRKIAPWQVGSSMVANQVSAISLIGAPAFIAVKEGGGLKWLQYELAVPLAMAVIIIVLVPIFRKNKGITIYEYLESRYGTTTRSTLSVIFLLSRSMATGVALLATSYVTSVCIGIPLVKTIIIIGFISLIYTALGGIKADIYSDIMQLVVLWISSFLVIGIIYNLLHGDITFLESSSSRIQVFDIDSTGLGDGNSFSLWPMLFGGLFLYISYYGCDQSQAQRLLATEKRRGAQKALVINGVMRFPLVLTYCAIGVLIIPFMNKFPEFSAKVSSLPPDYLMPHFFNDFVPAGLLGLIVAGVFAASMSSLDSAINSLSASTWEDILVKIYPILKKIPDKKKIYLSRIITVFWGIFAVLAAIIMAGSSETVIELVNKIGSAFYGPIAGVFILGMITRRTGESSALFGLITGISLNIVLWIGFESVSWMWWNLSGFFSTLCAGIISGFFLKNFKTGKSKIDGIKIKDEIRPIPVDYVVILVIWFLLIFACCAGIHFICS